MAESAILQGVTKSVQDHLSTEIVTAEQLAGITSEQELIEKIEEELEKLKKRERDERSQWESAYQLKNFYQLLSRDAYSFSADNPGRLPLPRIHYGTAVTNELPLSSIQEVLDLIKTDLETAIGMLKDESIAALQANLVANTKQASLLNNSFSDIDDILKALDKDLNQKDRAYAQLVEKLKEKDRENAQTTEIDLSDAIASLADETFKSPFEVFEDKGGEFRFRLKAANGEIILASEGYRSKQGRDNGILSVINNAPLDERYERKVAKDGQHYFLLKAGNHQVIGNSEMYTSKSAMENGIDSVKRNVESARTEMEAVVNTNSYVGKLAAFKPREIINDLRPVRSNFKKLYKNLKKLSLDFQETVAPKFDRIKAGVEEFKTALEAVNANIKGNLEGAEGEPPVPGAGAIEAATRGHLLDTTNTLIAREELLVKLQQLGKLEIRILPEAAAEAATATAPPAAEKTDAPPVAVDEEIAGRMAAVSEKLEAVSAELRQVKKNINELGVALDAKSEFNNTLNQYNQALLDTQRKSLRLKQAIDNLRQALDDTCKALTGLIGDSKNTSEEGDLSAFIKSLKTLGEVEAQIADLNSVISTAEVEGDIKVYFGDVNDILQQFPDPAKQVIAKTLTINHTLDGFVDWAEALLNEVLSDDLVAAFATSALDLNGSNASTDRLTALRNTFNDRQKDDHNFILDGSEEVIKVTAWDATWNQSDRPNDRQFNEFQQAQAAKEYSILEAWKAFFETEKELLEEQEGTLKKQKAFLEQFIDAPAPAA